MIAALFFGTVSALTPQEAQVLPLAELAQRVLGAAGAVVIDVERPRWQPASAFALVQCHTQMVRPLSRC